MISQLYVPPLLSHALHLCAFVSVMRIVMNHKEAWPFMEPVEEAYAPGYYEVIEVSSLKRFCLHT